MYTNNEHSVNQRRFFSIHWSRNGFISYEQSIQRFLRDHEKMTQNKMYNFVHGLVTVNDIIMPN